MKTGRLAAICTACILWAAAWQSPAAPSPSRAAAAGRLASLGRQIALLDEQYNQAAIDLARVQRDMRDADARKTKADAVLSQIKAAATKRAVAIYRTGAPELVFVWLAAKDPGDLSRRLAVASKIEDWEAGLVSSLQVAGGRARGTATDLKKDVAQAKAVADRLDKARRGLESQVSSQKQLLAGLDAEELAQRAAEAAAQRQEALAALTGLGSGSLLGPGEASAQARAAVATAYAQIGKLYHYGAAGPETFDCSGLTMFSWRSGGVSLPHSAAAQYSAAPRVARGALSPGDLVFFGSPIHHTGIYIGGGRMIHAPETGETVSIASISRSDYVGAVRPG